MIFLISSEGDNEVWYYSTPAQIDELLEVLDRDKWEPLLYMNVQDLRDEVTRHMDITEDLTMEHKGSKKAVLELEMGESFTSNFGWLSSFYRISICLAGAL